MDAQTNRLAARDYAESNICLLSADVLAWRKRATLPTSSKVHDLASLCVAFSSEGDEYQEAERLIVKLALEKAATNPSDLVEHTRSTADEPNGKSVIDDDAYKRLLPKLLELAEKIDGMSEDEYGSWVNALPKDEFFEFIGASHNAVSFNAAVSAARQLLTKSHASGLS